MAEPIDRDSQDWLLNALIGLVDVQGAGHFLDAPLLEPTTKFFPDEWEASIRGVEVLLKRLMLYAGLEELHPEVSAFTQADEIFELNEFGSPKSWGHEGAAAWFAGVEGKRCFFGVAERNISEPEILIASMCHEVAHAWRVVNGLAVDNRDEEELLTDVSTVYLGFGILTTNGSFRYRTSGEFDGINATFSCSHQRVGYLPPSAMSFLLAVQSMVRGMGWRARRRLSGLLETDQAYFYRRSVKLLKSCKNLKMRFPINTPKRKQPDSQFTHQHIRLPLAKQPLDEESFSPGFNEGTHVYRVKRNKKVPYAFWGAVTGMTLGFIVKNAGFGGSFFLTASALGAVLGGLAGYSRPWDYCSDPNCQALIPKDAKACSRCGGAIRGTISHPKERLVRDETIKKNGICH